MSLTKREVINSVSRLLTFYNPSEEQMNIYADALIEAVGWMRPEHFELVCIALLRDIGGRKPLPREFILKHREIGEPKGWYLKPTPRQCESCGGTSLVPKLWLHSGTGEKIRAMIPCPECGVKNWSIDRNLVELEGESAAITTVSMARSLQPRQAAYSWFLMERANQKFPDEVAAVLVEKWGALPEEEISMIRASVYTPNRMTTEIMRLKEIP